MEEQGKKRGRIGEKGGAFWAREGKEQHEIERKVGGEGGRREGELGQFGRLPAPLLSCIFSLATGGSLRRLLQLSQVCRAFHAALREVTVLRIDLEKLKGGKEGSSKRYVSKPLLNKRLKKIFIRFPNVTKLAVDWAFSPVAIGLLPSEMKDALTEVCISEPIRPTVSKVKALTDCPNLETLKWGVKFRGRSLSTVQDCVFTNVKNLSMFFEATSFMDQPQLMIDLFPNLATLEIFCNSYQHNVLCNPYHDELKIKHKTLKSLRVDTCTHSLKIKCPELTSLVVGLIPKSFTVKAAKGLKDVRLGLYSIPSRWDSEPARVVLPEKRLPVTHLSFGPSLAEGVVQNFLQHCSSTVLTVCVPSDYLDFRDGPYVYGQALNLPRLQRIVVSGNSKKDKGVVYWSRDQRCMEGATYESTARLLQACPLLEEVRSE